MALIGAAFIAVGVGLGVVSARLVLDATPAGLPPAIRELMVRGPLAGEALLATAVAVVVIVSAPRDHALRTVVNATAVPRWRSAVGLALPLLIGGIAFTVLFSGAPIAAVILAGDGAVGAALNVAGLLALICLQFALAASAVVILRWTLERARIPAPYSVSIGGGIVLAVAVLASTPSLLRIEVPGWLLLAAELAPHSAVAGLLLAPAALGVALALGWVIAAIALGWTGSRLPDLPGAASPLVLRGTRPPRTRLGALTWFEVILLLRTPQSIIVVLAAAGCGALAVASAGRPDLAVVTKALSAGALLVPFVAPVYTVGRSLSVGWMMSLVAAGSRARLLARVTAGGLVGLAIALPAGAILSLTGTLSAEELLVTAPRLLVMLLCALLAGTLVRPDDSQPLSTPIAGFAVALLYLGSSALIGLGASAGSWWSAATVVGLLAALSGGLVLAARPGSPRVASR